jgi:hypothetical protein
MNTVVGNGAWVTPVAATLPHHIRGTSPIGERFEGEPIPEAVAPPPILITENEVVFSTTAAAVPVRPTTVRGWRTATGLVLEVMHRMSLTPTADGARPSQDYPRRYVFLENSCMAREMDRL